MKHHTTRTTKAPALRRSAVFAALALAGVLPATAAIVTSGLVTPDPSSGNVNGTLQVGTTGIGSLLVDGGSVLDTQRLNAGQTPSGNGSVTVSGAGSKIMADHGVVGNFYNTQIGSQGVGSLSVLNGASFVNGLSDDTCKLGCRLLFSNGAGSDGTLLVSGAGSTVDTVGMVRVGYASLFTQAVSGFDYGVAGGASKGLASVLAGGTVNSSVLEIGLMDLGSELIGTETASGKVLVDGSGSVWNLVRNSAQTGGRSLIGMATVANTTATLEVKNGGLMVLDGSAAPNQFSGINMGSGTAATNTANSHSSLTVSGAGSSIRFQGGMGFFNIGNSIGATAQVDILAGGVISAMPGNGSTGLPFVSVGRGGGTGTLNISGSGSLLALNGRNPNTDGGAFLNVGRTDSGAAGNGTVNIGSGGRISIDTTGLSLTNGDALSGMFVGIGTGSTGALNVSGAGSRLDIMGGSGLAPYVGVGRDGATGSVTIAAGGVVEVNSSHVSAANPAGYPSGQALVFDVGRRGNTGDTSPSVGSVTISGAGSELTLTGATDSRLQIGSGANASGSVNIVNGGRFHGQTVLVGVTDASAIGTLNLNAGHLLLDGVRQGSTVAGTGGGVIIGRGGATGTMNVANASVVDIVSTGITAFVDLGGSSVGGGTGTLSVTGGSTFTVDSPGARMRVGATADLNGPAGVGTVNLLGSGSRLSMQGSDARIVIGSAANTIGQINVGSGSELTAAGLIGVAHNGSASTAGIGTLVVNGTATAAQLMIGQNGLLAGNGVVNANVTNQGTIGPGLSPGKLTINGAFDNSGGKIVLEVQSLGNGQYALDELVFADWSQVVLGDGAIEFVFLGDTDPTAFQDAGLFSLGSFFRQLDGNGNEAPLDSSLLALFADTSFSASAAQFAISGLGFDPLTGAFNATVATVPLPAPVLLTLLGLGLLAAQRRRQPRR